MTNPFKSWPRGASKPTLIVLHESVTRTLQGAVTTLQAEGYGVHFAIDRDGSVHEYVPLGRYCTHAGAGRNKPSIGIEIINRYYGASAGKEDRVIPASWAHRGQYILPTEAQMEALWGLVSRLQGEFGVDSFPGVADGKFTWGRVDKVYSGVSAHHRWAHADGLFPEHYCWLRSTGLNHMRAWAATVLEATHHD